MARRILLADDSVTIQKVIELTFMDEDYEVIAVSNGDEAVASLTERDPDVVIADVHMPGANGYEVCRRSKALRPEVPVLLLVGTFEPFDEAQSQAVGADAFLKKPFDSQELLQLVEQLLAAAGSAGSPAAAASPAFALDPFPPGPSEAGYPYGPAAAGAAPALGAEEPFGALEALAPLEEEAAWSNFDLTAEPEPAAFPAAAPEPEAAGGGWPAPALTYAPVEEQVFELDDSDDVLALDDSLLVEEAPAATGDAGAADAGGGFAFDDAFRREAEPSAPAPGSPDRLTGFQASPEESVGVPLGAAPLAGSLSEVQNAVSQHADAPAFAAAAASSAGAASGGSLSDEDVDRIARRIVELIGDRAVRDVAWEVIPDMAEMVIQARLRELESQVE